ncbi:hypothetical protein EDB84DRAFT_1567603 [Lactarius hengduanensis]|nr:hypothetical protein EDB84DRAFT_1567603 [Lactarius hengduanensis]
MTVLSSRAGHVTLSQLRGLYKTFAYVPTAADQNTLRVFGFQKDYLSKTDLTMFMTYFCSDVQPPSLATFTVKLVNSSRYEPNNPTIESNIDVQYASAMAYPTPIIFYSIGGSEKWSTDGSEPLPGDADLESLDHLLKKTDNPPWRSYVEVLVLCKKILKSIKRLCITTLTIWVWRAGQGAKRHLLLIQGGDGGKELEEQAEQQNGRKEILGQKWGR